MALINSFSVVAYVESPIAEFVDRLRRDLTPGCPHHAHVTILPPRPLSIEVDEAVERGRQILTSFDPFEIRLKTVDRFESTQVIKLSIESGLSELRTLHDILNTGPFEHREEYEYVPHITLCQDSPCDKQDELMEEARRRWSEFSPVPPMRVETLTLVQQAEDGTWKDLAELPLGNPVPVRVRR